jgi:hypothetical protein
MRKTRKSTLAWTLGLTLAGAVLATPAGAQQAGGGTPAGGPAAGQGASAGGAGGVRGGHIGKYDHDADRRLSPAEMRGVHGDMFRGWDTDRDDSIADVEFHAGVFGRLDADASGRLERAELAELERWGFREVEVARWDLDGDGFVSRDEYDDRVVSVSVFTDWDRNRDSRLDWDELDRGYLALYDADRDGYLVAEEYRPLTTLHSTGASTTTVQIAPAPADVEYLTVSIPVATVDVDRIVDAPEAYFGTMVAVEGEVEQKVGPHVYAFDEDGGAPDMLVLVPQGTAIPADSEVKIVGQLRPLVRAELERDYDWFDARWVREMRLRFDRDAPVLVASAVLDADGRSLFPSPR